MAACIQAMDVIGVDNGDNGQSCRQHPVCGNFVIPGDKLYCKWAIQNFDAGRFKCTKLQRMVLSSVMLGICPIVSLPETEIMAGCLKVLGSEFDVTYASQTVMQNVNIHIETLRLLSVRSSETIHITRELIHSNKPQISVLPAVTVIRKKLSEKLFRGN